MARNQLVENMLGEWLLMLDTDHVFAPDLLERLLILRSKYKAPLISGIYQYKFQPHAPVANLWTGSDDKNARLTPLADWDRSAAAIEVGATGAGCMLIDRALLKRVERAFGEGPFTIIPGLSEDYSFCYKCHKLGVPVLLAPQIECHHVINTVLSVQDYAPSNSGKIPVKIQGGTLLSTSALEGSKSACLLGLRSSTTPSTV